jgi:hypothetical protein
MTGIKPVTITEALAAADAARADYIAAGYHGTDEYLDVLEKLTETVREATRLSPGREGGIEHILAAVRGEVFRSDAGEAVVFLRDDPYVISVDTGGDTVSAYLVTVPPAEIAEALDADEAEIAGWSTGYDI